MFNVNCNSKIRTGISQNASPLKPVGKPIPKISPLIAVTSRPDSARGFQGRKIQPVARQITIPSFAANGVTPHLASGYSRKVVESPSEPLEDIESSSESDERELLSLESIFGDENGEFIEDSPCSSEERDLLDTSREPHNFKINSKRQNQEQSGYPKIQKK